jgi:hypothetical protein
MLLLLLLSSSFAALLVAAAAATDAAEHRTVRLDQQQKDAMRMIIKDMIGFRKLPSSDAVLPTLSDGGSSVQFGHRNQFGPSAAKRRRSSSGAQRIPGVMQRLYDQYQSGMKLYEADTVRNIHAQLGQFCLVYGSNVVANEIFRLRIAYRFRFCDLKLATAIK